MSEPKTKSSEEIRMLLFSRVIRALDGDCLSVKKGADGHTLIVKDWYSDLTFVVNVVEEGKPVV